MGKVLSNETGGSAAAGALPAASAAQLQHCLDRTAAYLHGQQRSGDHWTGTLSSSALATAMSIVALQLVDGARYREHIARGHRWLLQTQAGDGGWGDAVVDASNINATSLALAALTFTATPDTQAADQPALDRARACLERLGGFAAVGDPACCTLSGPCRTVCCVAGLMDWRHIKRLRPEVILLPARLRRTISTTFPAYLSIASLHSRMVPHPLNYLPSYGRATRAAARRSAGGAVCRGGGERAEDLVDRGRAAPGHRRGVRGGAGPGRRADPRLALGARDHPGGAARRAGAGAA